jgi:hypothetical protein
MKPLALLTFTLVTAGCSSGTPCTEDTQCPASDYCDFSLSHCSGVVGTVVAGTCRTTENTALGAGCHSGEDCPPLVACVGPSGTGREWVTDNSSPRLRRGMGHFSSRASDPLTIDQLCIPARRLPLTRPCPALPAACSWTSAPPTTAPGAATTSHASSKTTPRSASSSPFSRRKNG